jgi:RNA polymerase sigma-70 factor, ECF subfamily
MAVAPEATRADLAPPASETAEQLFQEHAGWIYGYCLRLLRSPEEAEDALQTTYLNACRSLNRGTRPEVGSAWLLRIAQNVCFARMRSSGRRGRLERSQDITVLEETVAAPERSRDELIGLSDALCSIPERQREAILLREWQGLSYSEVGTRLGLSQAAVETLIFRARRSLAELLDGRPAPRRARKFAFDFGSLGIALKTALGGTSAAKLAAGLAAALVMATTLGGSVEQPAPRAKAPAPVPAPEVVAPATPQDEAIAKGARPRKQAKTDDSQSREPKPRGATNAPAETAQPPGPDSSLGQELEETVGALPLGSEVTDTLPLGAATGLIDETVDEVDVAVDDVTELLP